MRKALMVIALLAAVFLVAVGGAVTGNALSGTASERSNASGTTGSDGADGADGSTGSTGSDESDGSKGADGADGVDGSMGPVGPQGEVGATGATGAAGPVGATGATGAMGPAGEAGEAGPAGPAGADGNVNVRLTRHPGSFAVQESSEFTQIAALSGFDAGTWRIVGTWTTGLFRDHGECAVRYPGVNLRSLYSGQPIYIDVGSGGTVTAFCRSLTDVYEVNDFGLEAMRVTE